MQLKTHAKANGPGPCLALIYKMIALPRKRKTAMIAVGYSNILEAIN